MTFTYTPPSSLTDPILTPASVGLSWLPSASISGSDAVLLLHFDGSFNDSSSVGNVMSQVGATLSSTSPKFGADCCSFTSATAPSTQYVRTPIVSSAPLDVLSGTGDFTIEGWARIDGSTPDVSFTILDFGSDQSSFNLNNGFTVSLDVSSLTSDLVVRLDTNIHDSVTSTPWGSFLVNLVGPTFGTWIHIAIVRTSGTVSFYVNGNSVLISGSPSWANYTRPATSFCTFGRTASTSGSEAFGSVDEWMVSNVARYSSNFTPPSAPFPNPGAPPGYIVYRDGVELGQVLVFGTTTFLDTMVTAGVSYTYTVAAQDGSNNPVSDLSSPLVVAVPLFPQNIFGAFAQADVYPPIVLANLEGIKPRIYVPIENNTVRSKQ